MRYHFYPRSPCGERPLRACCCWTSANFYPRSPCGERRSDHIKRNEKVKFLSTLSLRRATFISPLNWMLSSYFYPRSPCGERRSSRLRQTRNIKNFYPRSPCGERRGQQKLKEVSEEFLSTLSLRRATLRPTGNQPITPDFYPRSPCGERRRGGGFLLSFILFLSTLSLRRATRSMIRT